MRTVRLLMVAVAVAAATLLALPAQATSVSTACPTPTLALTLAAKATKIEERTLADGRTVTRFSNPGIVESVGEIIAESPHFASGGFDWFLRSNTYVEWLESNPCSGDDGYAFGFSVNSYRAPVGQSTPRTNIASNWDMRGALQYDHAVHDFDSVWGWKDYGQLNEGSCADTGGFHFFPDSAPGEVRSVVEGRARFLSINHLTATRRTASKHVVIQSLPAVHVGSGSGQWTSIPDQLPSGTPANC